MLEERCRARQNERAGRHAHTIGERLIADKAASRDPPATPFEPCHKYAAKVSSKALVRYRMNDDSVPAAYGFRDVLVKRFVDEVATLRGAAGIARHPRGWGSGEFSFEATHYMALLGQKSGALGPVALRQNGILPESLQHPRWPLEAGAGWPASARAGKAGAIARCLRRAFFRTPYGILDGIDSASPIMRGPSDEWRNPTLTDGSNPNFYNCKTGIDDPIRFRHSADVGPHFGPTPRHYESGETENGGAISKCGDAMAEACSSRPP